MKFKLEKTLPFESSLDKTVVTIGQVISQFLSINHSPKPTFLKSLSKLTSSETEKNFLSNLCEHDENQTKFTNEIKKNFINIVDILEMLPNVEITFHQLFNLLPKMYPRYYSISSSGIVHPTRLHITVGSLAVQTPSKTFKGLCSNYLVNLKENQLVHAFIRVSNFKMPKDLLEPILFISGGTGIAPFIGFVEEREVLMAQGHKLGPCLLFFGVRDENTFMHKKLLEEAFKKGIISDMFIVYSDQNNGNDGPMFVSEKVTQESDLVWKYLGNNSNIYICGGVSGFGLSVYNSLKSVVGKYSSENPQEYIDRLKKNGKCMEDLAD